MLNTQDQQNPVEREPINEKRVRATASAILEEVQRVVVMIPKGQKEPLRRAIFDLVRKNVEIEADETAQIRIDFERAEIAVNSTK